MHYGSASTWKPLSADNPELSKASKLVLGDFSPATGIGFSEFIELLGKIAIEVGDKKIYLFHYVCT